MPSIKHIMFDLGTFLITSVPIIFAILIIAKIKVTDKIKKLSKKCIFIILSTKLIQFITIKLLQHSDFPYNRDIYKGIELIVYLVILVIFGVFLFKSIKYRNVKTFSNN